MKSICIISCFDAFDNKIFRMEKVFNKNGISVKIITSDFDHRTRTKFTKYGNDNIVYINTIKYTKNFSIKRLFSHLIFSYKALKTALKFRSDYIYIFIPPNSLSLFSRLMIPRKTTVIFDVGDMWPETFPNTKRIYYMIPFHFWKFIRNFGFKRADYANFECGLFLKQFDKYNMVKNVLYPIKENSISKSIFNDDDTLRLAYLGSINNIIDIDLITNTLIELSKKIKIEIDIIGDGEKRQEFIEKLKIANLVYRYHGFVFDETKKREILSKIDFGFNIMKKNVFIGLSLKTIEYSSYGIPILNNVGNDTQELLDSNRSGINYNDNLDTFTDEIIHIKRNLIKTYSDNALQMYFDNFSPEIFDEKMHKIVYFLKSR